MGPVQISNLILGEEPEQKSIIMIVYETMITFLKKLLKMGFSIRTVYIKQKGKKLLIAIEQVVKKFPKIRFHYNYKYALETNPLVHAA